MTGAREVPLWQDRRRDGQSERNKTRIIVLRSAMSSILPPAVLDYLAAYQTGNTSRLHECIAPNVSYLNVTDEGGMRSGGSPGVAEIIEGVHELLADIRLTITEQRVDDGVVRLAGFLDATSKLTIAGGFQYGQRVHLPIRLAIKVENNRIVKLFESS